MVNFRSFIENISKRNRSIIFGCILVFFLLYFVKSCGIDHFMVTAYQIGQDNRWSTINLMGKEQNLTAFNNQLLSSIAKEENFKFSIRSSPSSDLINDLENGRLQGVLTTLQSSYLHDERLVFSAPYFLTGPVLIIPSSAPLQGWNEKGKKIVAIPYHSPILSILEQDPGIQIKIYPDILQALSDLSKRQIDGAIFPAIPSYTYVNAFYQSELKIATLPLTDEGVRLVVQKNEQGKELLDQFNKGLATIKENGAFTQLLDRWGFVNVEDLHQ